MSAVLLIIHLLIAIALIVTVLLQRSEGGALGIGGGGAGALFSSRGTANVLTRSTAVLAVAFFITSIALTILARQGSNSGSVFDRAPPSGTQQNAPVAPGSGGGCGAAASARGGGTPAIGAGCSRCPAARAAGADHRIETR